MMWLFGILVVLALGGIALLAAGRGTPMAEVYDDRPDATVPTDRALGPEDLRTARFSVALRGYRMSEVDALLERLADEQSRTRSAPPIDPTPTGADAPVDLPADQPADQPVDQPAPPHSGDDAGHSQSARGDQQHR